MKKILFIILFLLSNLALGAPRLVIQFSESKIIQGSIVQATLTLDADSFQQLDVQKLKAQTLAETVYLHNVGSFIRRSGENAFEADALVILVKIPETKELLHKNEQSEIRVSLNDVEVLPTETPQEFIFGEFTAPGNKKYFLWFLALAALLLSVFFGRIAYRKIKAKNERKRIKAGLKNQLLEVKSYEEAVKVWENKQLYLKEFPAIEPSFLNFQGVLFKSLFKPQKSELEKQEVLNAFKTVSLSLQEKKDGV